MTVRYGRSVTPVGGAGKSGQLQFLGNCLCSVIQSPAPPVEGAATLLTARALCRTGRSPVPPVTARGSDMNSCNNRLISVASNSWRSNIIHACWECPTGHLFLTTLCGQDYWNRYGSYHAVTCKKCLKIMNNLLFPREEEYIYDVGEGER